MRAGIKETKVVRNIHGVFRLSVENDGHSYYWESGDCYGYAPTEDKAWERAKKAILGPCEFCERHV